MVSPPLRQPLTTLAWGGSQASAGLAFASGAWMLSGLTASPLLNGLLPAMATAAALRPLRRRCGLGYALQLVGLLALLAIALTAQLLLLLDPARLRSVRPLLAWITLLATLLWAIGQHSSLPSLHRQLLGPAGLNLPLLRGGAEGGRLLGSLLTGLLFPLGRAVLQFSVALLLLLPLLPTVSAARRLDRCSAASPTGELPVEDRQTPSPARLHRRGLAQGMLFGSLFALLPLWVRQQAKGNCLDFGMVLTAYALGRTLVASCSGLIPRAGRWGITAGRIQYALMAVLLTATQGLPGWVAAALFLPFGMLAGLRDQALLMGMASGPGGQPDLAGLERSGALGGLVGTLLMGLVSQMTSLSWALPLQVGGFLMAALLIPTRQGRAAHT